MPNPAQLQTAVDAVRDQASLLRLLSDTLEWPIEGTPQDIGEIAFAWSPEELNAGELTRDLLAGQVWQIQPFRSDQPWGVFLLEFVHEKVYRTHLRRILRGLVPSRNKDPNQQA